MWTIRFGAVVNVVKAYGIWLDVVYKSGNEHKYARSWGIDEEDRKLKQFDEERSAVLGYDEHVNQGRRKRSARWTTISKLGSKEY